MLDSEREFVDLLFRACKKYASWDPEIVMEPGDYGKISTGHVGLAFWRRGRGTFIKEGNIYKDGLAQENGIPPPQEFGTDASEGVTWIVSQNVEECDLDGVVGGQTPAFAQCKIKGSFKVTSGRGAILVMNNDAISTIEPPGCLRRLLDKETMRGYVIVSQAHRCSSYARLLTMKGGQSVAIGLSAEPPVSNALTATADAHWVRSSNAGNFKSKTNKNGNRDYYPLFKLVSLTDKDTSSGLRDAFDAPDDPLPDAIPPWQTDLDPEQSVSVESKKSRFRLSLKGSTRSA